MSLTNSQVDEIMRMYSRRQTEDRRLEDLRRSRAYAQIPELAVLDREVSESAALRLRKSLYGNEAVSPAPSSDSDEKRRSLLISHGFPADYLDPVFQCPDCHDTGYIDNVPCHCFRQAAIDLFYTQSGLKEVLQRENFDTFSLRWYPDTLTDPVTGLSSRRIMEDISSQCRRFCRDFDHLPDPCLLLSGPPGLGKTFLSHCIAKELMDSGHSVIYYSAGELFRRLADQEFRSSRENTYGDDDFDADYLTSCDLLIIDDLGTEVANTFTVSSLFSLLTARTGRRKGIIISTNLSLGELNTIYSERIASRLAEHFDLLTFFGPDVRVQKRLGDG